MKNHHHTQEQLFQLGQVVATCGVSADVPAERQLISLCHKFLRLMIFWQHGHRGRVRAIARAIAMRTDVREFGT